MHIRARRRSLRFDGRTVTISIATKSSLLFPGDTKHRFSVRKITEIVHQPPSLWQPGKIVFVVTGAPQDVVDRVPLFADKLDRNTFVYPARLRAKAAALVAAIENARI